MPSLAVAAGSAKAEAGADRINPAMTAVVPHNRPASVDLRVSVAPAILSSPVCAHSCWAYSKRACTGIRGEANKNERYSLILFRFIRRADAAEIAKLKPPIRLYIVDYGWKHVNRRRDLPRDMQWSSRGRAANVTKKGCVAAKAITE
jgi:hypothetical protein